MESSKPLHYTRKERLELLCYDVPEQIYKSIARCLEPRRLYICSPWLSELSLPLESRKLPIFALITGRLSSIRRFEVYTRPPSERDERHREAIDKLKDLRATILTCEILHAKIYAVEAKWGSFTIIGSVNLTRSARSNIEVAIKVVDEYFVHRVIGVLKEYIRPLCIPYKVG